MGKGGAGSAGPPYHYSFYLCKLIFRVVVGRYVRMKLPAKASRFVCELCELCVYFQLMIHNLTVDLAFLTLICLLH